MTAIPADLETALADLGWRVVSLRETAPPLRWTATIEGRGISVGLNAGDARSALEDALRYARAMTPGAAHRQGAEASLMPVHAGALALHRCLLETMLYPGPPGAGPLAERVWRRLGLVSLSAVDYHAVPCGCDTCLTLRRL